MVIAKVTPIAATHQSGVLPKITAPILSVTEPGV